MAEESNPTLTLAQQLGAGQTRTSQPVFTLFSLRDRVWLVESMCTESKQETMSKAGNSCTCAEHLHAQKPWRPGQRCLGRFVSAWPSEPAFLLVSGRPVPYTERYAKSKGFFGTRQRR